MKNIFNFIAGFFNSESNNSSKRLVGIIGALSLFYTLYENSKTEGHFAPAESLVWGTVALSGVALGLTTIESITGLVKGFRGTDKSDSNGEASE
jgi:hypothetical protein